MSLVFSVDGDNATVTGYSGTVPEDLSIIIPATYTDNGVTYPVTAIGSSAFDGYTTLISVTFPDTLTSIGDYAFTLTGLTSVTIPKNVTYVGVHAFEGCSFLEAVTFARDSKLEGTQRYAFTGCIKLRYVTFSSGSIFSNIEEGVFQSCIALQTIEFPSTLIRIASNAFYGCSTLNNLTFPDSLERIETSAFYNCTGLETLTFLGSKPLFGFNVFIGTSVSTTTPASISVFYVDGWGWSDSLAIQSTGGGSVSYPVNLIYSFRYSVSDGKATITGYDRPTVPATLPIPATYTDEEGVTYPVTAIGNNAFKNQTTLVSVTFPANSTLESIGDGAFQGCTGITGALTFPANLASIGNGAFLNCIRITTLTFPTSLTSIGNGAFYSCVGITTLTFPDNSSLTSIGDGAFQGCTSLARYTPITFPANLTEIRNSAFKDCSQLWLVTFLGNIPIFGTDVFVGTYDTFRINALSGKGWTTQLSIRNSTGGGVSRYTVTISATVFIYKTNSSNDVTVTGFESLEPLPSTLDLTFSLSTTNGENKPITAIGENAFLNQTTIETVILSEFTKIIGKNAFRGNTSMTRVTFPASVNLIGEGAFYRAPLTLIRFLGTICPELGKDAFVGAKTNLFTVIPSRAWGVKFIDVP